MINEKKSLAKFEKKAKRNFKDAYFLDGEFHQDEKVSQRIFNIANLTLDYFEIEIDKKLLDSVILAWNMSIMETFEETRKVVEKSIGTDFPDSDSFLTVMSVLKSIKEDLYPNDLRMIKEYEVLERNGQIRLNVASALTENDLALCQNEDNTVV